MKYDKRFDTISIEKEDGMVLTKEELINLLFKNGWGIMLTSYSWSKDRWEDLKSKYEVE